MSEDDKIEQSATDETKDSAQQGSTGAKDAQDTSDDFDKALSEFESAEESSSEQKATGKSDDASEDLAARLERLERQESEREYRSDLEQVISSVRGDFSEDEVENETIDAWVNGQAKKDARIANAWMKRHDDPAKFKRVVQGLKDKFAEKHARLRNVDEGATADRMAVAHAVRNASARAPEGKTPDYSKMNDREFQEVLENLPDR